MGSIKRTVKKNYLQILVVFFILSSFLITAFPLLDLDFGWHLQLGNYILLHGIPVTDPFSYTMPHFPFIDHEWATNIVIAKLFPIIGTSGLTILFCLIAIIPLVIYAVKYSGKISLFLLFLIGGALVNFIGIRPQLLDWVFADYFFLLFFSQKLWQKYRFSLPFAMILWVNLHGGFAIGIFFLLLYLCASVIFEGKLIFKDFFVLILCLMATFLNPYGPGIWVEVFRQITDTRLRQMIYEWMPTYYFFRPLLWTYILISLFFVIKALKQLPKQHLVFYFVLFFLGMSSLRQMPFWLLYSFPVTVSAARFFVSSISLKFKYEKERLFFIYRSLFVLMFIVWILQYYSPLSGVNYPDFYPKQALAYLKLHPYEGQLFAPYEWGGYLEWQYPNHKVFIDGRMPSWRWQSPYKKESSDAFAEYQAVLAGKKPITDIISKYDITRIIFYKALSDKPAVVKIIQTDLAKNGMKKIYQDNTAVIYGK
jgi:hypothetical protein